MSMTSPKMVTCSWDTTTSIQIRISFKQTSLSTSTVKRHQVFQTKMAITESSREISLQSIIPQGKINNHWYWGSREACSSSHDTAIMLFHQPTWYECKCLISHIQDWKSFKQGSGNITDTNQRNNNYNKESSILAHLTQRKSFSPRWQSARFVWYHITLMW